MTIPPVLPDIPDLERIRAAVTDIHAIPALVQRLTHENHAWNEAALNLVASHNFMSPAAKALLSSSLADHIMSGALGQRNHAGAAWIDAIDTIVVELCKRIFGATYVEYRPMSGAQANGLALIGLLRHGDTVMAIPARLGGHHTYRESGYAGVLGARIVDIPHTDAGIDLGRLEDIARRERPKLLMVGTAELLFPYPLKELREIADHVGAHLYYDGAHILGLAAGQQYQDPLREGAEFLIGSSQKTLGGPIGGLILTTNDEAGSVISRRTSHLVSNYHNNRIAALALTLAEMSAFGKDFAAQVVRNARVLAETLDQQGATVLGKEMGFTDSHIVLLDATRMPIGVDAYRRLEQARILSSRVPLPHSYPDRSGIRLGTAAMTRLGAREQDMVRIASLITRVISGEPPAEVAPHVTEIARAFTKVHFCF